MRRLRRGGWHALAATGIAPACAACGGGSGGALSLDPVAKAATVTAKVSSEKVSLRATISAAALPKPVAFTAQGAMDNTSRRGRMTIDLSQFAKSVPSGPLADPTLWRGEEVFDSSHGLVIYMKLPFITTLAHSDKPWIKIDLATLGKRMGIDISQFTQLGSGNPTQSLDYLRATSGKIEKVGSDDVRGTPTTHYRARVDLDKYPNLVAASRRDAMRKSVKKLIELAGQKTFAVEVWIDARKYVRRMKMTMPTKTPQGTATTSMTMEFYDFGTPVSVDLPAADQTTDLETLMKNAGG